MAGAALSRLSRISENPSRHRYAAEKIDRDRWVIIDTHTGQPAASDGKDLTGLDETDAHDIATLLNDSDRSGSPSPLI
jgi:hypothetical protein